MKLLSTSLEKKGAGMYKESLKDPFFIGMRFLAYTTPTLIAYTSSPTLGPILASITCLVSTIIGERMIYSLFNHLGERRIEELEELKNNITVCYHKKL
ncbi:MAG: hypothetical protein DRP00_03165 [Candidatus Aenigmatarchaeota archaeon]|nr:MAG: hypothetical protein DRP00_03165 [Candidatus Aenigmarchaeota archaeon]